MNINPKNLRNRDPLMGFLPEPTLRAAIVRWAESQSSKPTLSEAIGHLEVGEAREVRARKMAGDTIDSMGDTA
jgi:hypothetical protein